MSVKVPDKTKREMEEFKDRVEWPSEIREFIEARLDQARREDTLEQVERMLKNQPKVRGGVLHQRWFEKIVTAVIDASALVAFCLNEEGLDRQRLKTHFREGAISVDLIRAESANAILFSKRRGVTKDNTVKLALSSMLALSRNNIKLIPQDDELISNAFEVSESTTLAIYDSLYLSLSRRG